MIPNKNGFWLAIFVSILIHCVEAIPIGNGVVGEPTITCGSTEISVQFDTQNTFEGNVYVKGLYNSDECRVRAASSISLPFESCNVRRTRSLNPKGVFVSSVVIISFHPLFITKVDRAYRVQCFYMEADKTVSTQLEISMLTTEFHTQNIPMPTCRYEVVREGPDGDPVTFAIVGEPVYHKWTCDTETEDTFCMRVHSCIVEDSEGENRQGLLDERGCTLDIHLLNTPEYPANLMAGVEAHVFKYADKAQLFFQCQISISVKDPEIPCLPPPDCGPETAGVRLTPEEIIKLETKIPLTRKPTPTIPTETAPLPTTRSTAKPSTSTSTLEIETNPPTPATLRTNPPSFRTNPPATPSSSKVTTTLPTTTPTSTTVPTPTTARSTTLSTTTFGVTTVTDVMTDTQTSSSTPATETFSSPLPVASTSSEVVTEQQATVTVQSSNSPISSTIEDVTNSFTTLGLETTAETTDLSTNTTFETPSTPLPEIPSTEQSSGSSETSKTTTAPEKEATTPLEGFSTTLDALTDSRASTARIKDVTNDPSPDLRTKDPETTAPSSQPPKIEVTSESETEDLDIGTTVPESAAVASTIAMASTSTDPEDGSTSTLAVPDATTDTTESTTTRITKPLLDFRRKFPVRPSFTGNPELDPGIFRRDPPPPKSEDNDRLLGSSFRGGKPEIQPLIVFREKRRTQNPDERVLGTMDVYTKFDALDINEGSDPKKLSEILDRQLTRSRNHQSPHDTHIRVRRLQGDGVCINYYTIMAVFIAFVLIYSSLFVLYVYRKKLWNGKKYTKRVR